MQIQLDHLLVPSKDKNGAARLLAEILGVRWDPCGKEPAAPSAQTAPPTVRDISDEQWRQYRAQRASVYVNDSLTIDFVDPQFLGAEQSRVPIHHYCFRVSDAAFDAILERVNRIGLSTTRALSGCVNVNRIAKSIRFSAARAFTSRSPMAIPGKS